MYVAGLYDYVQLLGSKATPINFAVWGSIFFTLFAFLIVLVQAGSSGILSTVLGIHVPILNALTIITIGFVVTTSGLHLSRKHLESTPELSQALFQHSHVLGGGICCLFFWTALVALSQFYTSYSFSAAEPNSASPACNDQLQLPPAYHNTNTLMKSPPPAYK